MVAACAKSTAYFRLRGLANLKDADKTMSDEVNLDKYFSAIWRAKWLILIVVVACAAIATYLARRQPTTYTAEAIVEVGRVWKEPLEDTYITEQVVKSAGFMHELAAKIGVKAKQLRNRVQSEAIIVGPRVSRYPILLKITASADYEDEAERLAQDVADELISRHEKLFNEALAPHKAREQKLEEQLKELKAQASSSREWLFKLEDELDTAKFNNASPTVTRKTSLKEPVVATATIPPTSWRNAASAALLAFIACVTLVALAAYFKPSPSPKSP
jgi:LPS O-antigen subunit length determinant protein (WzzB/FepE family)